MHELDAALVEQGAVGIVGVDDDEMLLVEVEMALDQRQRAVADRAEADHHDRAFDAPVLGPVRHGVVSPFGMGRRRASLAALKAMAFQGRQ